MCNNDLSRSRGAGLIRWAETLETVETRARQASVFMVPRLSGLMDNDETVVLLAFYRVSGFEYGLSMTILGILSKSRLYVIL